MAQHVEQGDQGARDVGQRQSLFREANEHIEELAPGLDLVDALPILCECASVECNERIEMTAAEYERLRRIPTHFAVVAGHDIPAVERVIEETDRYVVVEKFGESAAAAVDLDPRRRRRS